jgi:hypothetical protein
MLLYDFPLSSGTTLRWLHTLFIIGGLVPNLEFSRENVKNIIGSPKRRVECTNNASKCQFALSSPHSFVICRAPQALN